MRQGSVVPPLPWPWALGMHPAAMHTALMIGAIHAYHIRGHTYHFYIGEDQLVDASTLAKTNTVH